MTFLLDYKWFSFFSWIWTCSGRSSLILYKKISSQNLFGLLWIFFFQLKFIFLILLDFRILELLLEEINVQVILWIFIKNTCTYLHSSQYGYQYIEGAYKWMHTHRASKMNIQKLSSGAFTHTHRRTHKKKYLYIYLSTLLSYDKVLMVAI